MRIKELHSKAFANKFEYLDTLTERLYHRVIGGLSWPGKGPGFAVVIGEEIGFRPPVHAYLIAEAEGQDAGELIERCKELTRDCLVSAWYGRTDDRESMDFLSFHNRQARERREADFKLLSAPYSDGGKLAYHLNLLLTLLSERSQTLYLRSGSRLPGYLMDVQAADMVRAKAEDFPAVAALGYAASAISTYEQQHAAEAQETAQEWDPNDFI